MSKKYAFELLENGMIWDHSVWKWNINSQKWELTDKNMVLDVKIKKEKAGMDMVTKEDLELIEFLENKIKNLNVFLEKFKKEC